MCFPLECMELALFLLNATPWERELGVLGTRTDPVAPISEATAGRNDSGGRIGRSAS
jgi:hypothetical protein